MNGDVVNNLALAMYANEPCRICGRIITHADVGVAVFAGYSEDSASRAAHQRCWVGYCDIAKDMGIVDLVTGSVTAQQIEHRVAAECGSDVWTWNPDTKILCLDYSCSGETNDIYYSKEEAPDILRKEARNLMATSLELMDMAEQIETEQS